MAPGKGGSQGGMIRLLLSVDACLTTCRHQACMFAGPMLSHDCKGACRRGENDGVDDPFHYIDRWHRVVMLVILGGAWAVDDTRVLVAVTGPS